VYLLKQYLYRHTLGFTKNEELLSGMIRAGLIDREAISERLPHDNESTIDDISPCLNELVFAPGQVQSVVEE
jgi:hypothetical protein